MCIMNRITDKITCLETKDENKKDLPCVLHGICSWLYPDKSAIEYHDVENVKIINYGELQVAKETIATHLRCIKYPEFIGINFDILGYCIPALILGIIDSGHSFFNIPLDPLICKDIFRFLHVKYVFTKSNQQIPNKKIICQIDIHGQLIYLTRLIDVQESVTSNRKWYYFAYAIATSGSTGTPKIVKVSHACILPNIIDLRTILDITSSDKIAQLTHLTFDPSIVEIFLSIYCAATLFMVSNAFKNEGDRLLEKIFHAHVTILQITPSLLFHQWSTEHLKITILGKDSKLRILLLGGEPFPNKKLISAASHSQNMTRLFNIYGITEISCWSSINEIVRNDISIDESYLGEPLSQTTFQIRNEHNEVITKGKGKLYIGSNNRVCIVGNETEEDLNKPVFRNTGDIVSIDDQGRIFYKGRQNNIIKRFGNKVNLRDLERVVTDLNFVQNCATFWDQKSHKLYLCLSINKSKEDFSNLRNDILTHLKILPAVCKPDKIIIVEHFKFTTSGKISTASLRKICKDSESEAISTNDTDTNIDEIFGNLWNDHVKCKDAGFLMSGGTSITALQISRAAVEIFKEEFPKLISMLLKDSTFDECLNYIKRTLTCQDRKRNITYCIDISFYNDSSPSISNTENSIMQKISSYNLPLSTHYKKSYQWYKCRGRIYGDALIQDVKPFLENVSNIEVLKTYNLKKCIDASTTVYSYSENELFATVGSHAGIICTINLAEINNSSYEVTLPDRIEASVLVLSDFHGIVGCYDGYIYCINLKTGEIIWKFQTEDMVKCTAITCAQRSRIFVGSYDHHVYCLSVTDGNLIWKVKASQGGICATGCLHDKSTSILFGTLDGTCLALQQFTGQIIWKHKLTDPIFVTPAILQTSYVLFCSVAGILCCFDIETDCQIWQYVIDGNIFSYPVIQIHESTNSEYIILASHNKNLYCLELSNNDVLHNIDNNDAIQQNKPKLKCILQLNSPIFATPWCENEYIFVACIDGTFKVFNILEDKLITAKQLPGETFSSPVIHNKLAVLGCRDDNLYILKFV